MGTFLQLIDNLNK